MTGGLACICERANPGVESSRLGVKFRLAPPPAVMGRVARGKVLRKKLRVANVAHLHEAASSGDHAATIAIVRAYPDLAPLLAPYAGALLTSAFQMILRKMTFGWIAWGPEGFGGCNA